VSEAIQPSGRKDVIERRLIVNSLVLAGILPQVAQFSTDIDGPGCRRRLTGQDTHHRGLAGSVAPDDAHLVAGLQRERQSIDEHNAAHLDEDVANLQSTHR
jgi:hypothetical protein